MTGFLLGLFPFSVFRMACGAAAAAAEVDVVVAVCLDLTSETERWRDGNWGRGVVLSAFHPRLSLLACALDQLRCWQLQLQHYIGNTPMFISMSSKSEYFDQRQRHTTLWSLDRRPDQYLRPHLPFTDRPSRSIARLSFHTSRPAFFPLLANLLIQANATFNADLDQIPQVAVSPESIFSRTSPVVPAPQHHVAIPLSPTL